MIKAEFPPRKEFSPRLPKIQFIFLPGNLHLGIPDSHRATSEHMLQLAEELGFPPVSSVLESMPDPFLARKENWLSWLDSKIDKTAEQIVISESSGSEAVLRYLEQHYLFAAILSTPYHTSLEYDLPPIPQLEKLSGYFDSDWDWKSISRNLNNATVIIPTEDRVVKPTEQMFVADQINTRNQVTVMLARGRGHNLATGIKRNYLPEVEFAVQRVLLELKKKKLESS